MRLRRSALAAALVLVALLVQATVLARLPLPGAAPDLVLVVVVGFALAGGPLPGTVTGFAAGLLADLGADHELGRTALVLTLVGYLAGLLADDGARSRLLPLLVVGGAAAGAVTLYAAEGILLGDRRITGEAYAAAMTGTVPYCVLLTPLVVPAVGALVRRLDLDPLRR
ncbi:MAG: rod shape-determining protein [Frankiales bacterium]|nr:rod shape-determining protein [Frankiales bacterium]